MDEPDLAERAGMHAAVGEPVRLGIVEALVATDLTSTELAERFDLPTNLLAHHLAVLERAGLIERAASAGDRRRRYVRLRHDRLAGLAVGGAGPPVGRVLFVCSHNSARSQLAAALWQARTGTTARSAGTHPATRVHPGAIAAAERAGLDLSAAVPRLIEPADLTADTVVTVCDRAHEELDGTDTATWLHWSIPDPAETGTRNAFDVTVTALDARIAVLNA